MQSLLKSSIIAFRYNDIIKYLARPSAKNNHVLHINAINEITGIDIPLYLFLSIQVSNNTHLVINLVELYMLLIKKTTWQYTSIEISLIMMNMPKEMILNQFSFIIR